MKKISKEREEFEKELRVYFNEDEIENLMFFNQIVETEIEYEGFYGETLKHKQVYLKSRDNQVYSARLLFDTVKKEVSKIIPEAFHKRFNEKDKIELIKKGFVFIIDGSVEIDFSSGKQKEIYKEKNVILLTPERKQIITLDEYDEKYGE